MKHAYSVVEEFEDAIAQYTGALYAVAVNSCSMAILLAAAYWLRFDGIGRIHKRPLLREFAVQVPRRTYCSVPNAIVLAGGAVEWTDEEWRGAYQLKPLPVWDSARRFTSRMYEGGQFQCVSFQTSKILGLEQGGAILHDDPEADLWLRRARFDGRLNAAEKLPRMVGWHCYMNPSTAALGLARLACLPRHNPDQCGSEAFEDLSGLGIW